MNRKSIEISKSSLLSLKAEVLRKQQEVDKSRIQAAYVKITAPSKRKVVFKNIGVEERSTKDQLENYIDEDIFTKSRAALEAKTKLYEKLVKGDRTNEDNYLVEFSRKDNQFENYKNNNVQNQRMDGENNDWVEYTDCLGRSRMCLKRDLPHVQSRDKKLSATLPPEKLHKNFESKVEELTVLDEIKLRHEEIRQQWEKKEQELADKKNIYYQDVLFNEARSHGVGYFSFSQDDEERLKQQNELKKLREETKHKQADVQKLREMREKQIALRTKAARNRKRARMGLPPEEDDDEPETEIVSNKKAQEDIEARHKEEESMKERERQLEILRNKHVRPWDIGKDGVREIKTQERWIKDKRDERQKEFAPPSFYRGFEKPQMPQNDINQDIEENKSLYFTTKKNKKQNVQKDCVSYETEIINPFTSKRRNPYKEQDNLKKHEIINPYKRNSVMRNENIRKNYSQEDDIEESSQQIYESEIVNPFTSDKFVFPKNNTQSPPASPDYFEKRLIADIPSSDKSKVVHFPDSADNNRSATDIHFQSSLHSPGEHHRENSHLYFHQKRNINYKTTPDSPGNPNRGFINSVSSFKKISDAYTTSPDSPDGTNKGETPASPDYLKYKKKNVDYEPSPDSPDGTNKGETPASPDYLKYKKKNVGYEPSPDSPDDTNKGETPASPDYINFKKRNMGYEPSPDSPDGTNKGETPASPDYIHYKKMSVDYELSPDSPDDTNKGETPASPDYIIYKKSNIDYEPSPDSPDDTNKGETPASPDYKHYKKRNINYEPFPNSPDGTNKGETAASPDFIHYKNRNIDYEPSPDSPDGTNKGETPASPDYVNRGFTNSIKSYKKINVHKKIPDSPPDDSYREQTPASPDDRNRGFITRVTSHKKTKVNYNISPDSPEDYKVSPDSPEVTQTSLDIMNSFTSKGIDTYKRKFANIDPIETNCKKDQVCKILNPFISEIIDHSNQTTEFDILPPVSSTKATSTIVNPFTSEIIDPKEQTSCNEESVPSTSEFPSSSTQRKDETFLAPFAKFTFSKNKQLIPSSKYKKSKHSASQTKSFKSTPIINEIEEPDEVDLYDPFETDSEDDRQKQKHRRGKQYAAIPPPATFEYYGPSSSVRRKVSTLSSKQEHLNELKESIAAGLKYLRQQSERKHAKTDNVGYFD